MFQSLRNRENRLLLLLVGLVLITACDPSPASPTAISDATPTYPSLPVPEFSPALAPTSIPVDIAKILDSITDEELEEYKSYLVPFMDELEQMGKRSSMYNACQTSEDGGVAGSQYAGELANELAETFGSILNRGMGGASIACIIDQKSSLGGSKITLIYDLTDPVWFATEQQLRHELEAAGIPGESIEGAYAEYDFFPSGSFRIPSITEMGLPEDLQVVMSFLMSDVVIHVSNPETVCGLAESNVPAGQGAIGEVVEVIGRNLAAALEIPLTRTCVTWGEYGSVIAVDLHLDSGSTPKDPLPALEALLESYGASEIESDGYRLFGGAGFTNANIAGRNVTGVINLNGNDAFDPSDGDPVPAYIGVTVTMQIAVN